MGDGQKVKIATLREMNPPQGRTAPVQGAVSLFQGDAAGEEWVVGVG